MDSKVASQEDALFKEHNFDQQPPPDIVAYNELRSCADLYRMYEEKILDIQPEFQRDVVWSPPDQTRFIDSLIKQLPIPSMCFSMDFKTQRWQVIDGLQRMSSITRFLGDKDWKLSRLGDIDSRLGGKSVKEFQTRGSELHNLYQRVQNLTLPITVIRCDFSNQLHSDYLFTIFHRLNTGGMRLNNQEIRNCIYSGPFNNLLKQLDNEANWKRIKKFISGTTNRFRSVELILRFFSFYFESDKYRGNLARHLNHFMAKFRQANAQQLQAFELLFKDTTAILHQAFGEGAEKVGFSQLETLLVGAAKGAKILANATHVQIRARVNTLLGDPSLASETLQADLSNTEKVKARLAAAERIFTAKL